MKTSIYEYRDYKKLVQDLLESSEHGGRGKRKALAEAIRCQGAFITHVLSGNCEFSLEQADACTQFFGLAPDEAEFFLLLVNHNRAGTPSLRNFFQKKLTEKIVHYNESRARFKTNESIALDDQAKFYSTWKYAAIHVATTLPDLQTREAIAKRLRLPLDHVTTILQFLIEKGVVEKKHNQYLPIKNMVNLDKSSPFMISHHIAWRNRAIESLDNRKPTDYHYSVVLTCPVSRLAKIRERLMETVEVCVAECLENVKPGESETLTGLCMDFFEL